MVVGGSSTLGLPSTDLRKEWGRLNTGLGVVGIGGFSKGVKEREGGLEDRGEFLQDAGFAVRSSREAESDEGDIGGEPRSMKEPWTGLGLYEGGSCKERTEEAEWIELRRSKRR